MTTTYRIIIVTIAIFSKTIISAQSNKIFGYVLTVDNQPLGNSIVSMDDNKSELTTTQEGYYEIKFALNKNNELIKNINVEKKEYDPIPLNRLVLDDAVVVGRKSALKILLHKRGNLKKDLLTFLNKKTNGEINKVLLQNKNLTIAAQKKQLQIKNLGLDKLIDLYINTEYKSLEKEDKDFYKAVLFSSNYQKIDSLIRSRGEIRKAKRVLLKTEMLAQLNEKQRNKVLNKYARQSLEDALSKFMVLDLEKVDSLLQSALTDSRGDFLIQTSYTYGAYLQTTANFVRAQEIYDDLLIEVEYRMKKYKDSIHYKHYVHNTLLKLGYLALDKNDVKDAKDYFDKAQIINNEIDKIFGDSNDRTVNYIATRAKTYEAIGSLQFDIGNYGDAVNYNNKSLKDYQLLIDNGFSEYNASQALLYLNLSSIYLGIQEPNRSEQYLESGLKACEGIDVEGNWDNRSIWARLNILKGETLLNIAMGGNILDEDAQINDEHFDNYESYVLKGMEIFKTLFLINNNIFANDYTYSLNSLGKFNLIKGRSKKAGEYFVKALKIAHSMYTKKPTAFRNNYAESLNNVFLFFYRFGNYKEAEKYAHETQSIYTDLKNTNSKYLELEINLQINLLSMYYTMLDDEIDEQKRETINKKAAYIITTIEDNINLFEDTDTKIRYMTMFKQMVSMFPKI